MTSLYKLINRILLLEYVVYTGSISSIKGGISTSLCPALEYNLNMVHYLCVVYIGMWMTKKWFFYCQGSSSAESCFTALQNFHNASPFVNKTNFYASCRSIQNWQLDTDQSSSDIFVNFLVIKFEMLQPVRISSTFVYNIKCCNTILYICICVYFCIIDASLCSWKL